MSRHVEPSDNARDTEKPVIRFKMWQRVGIIGSILVIVITGIVLVLQDQSSQFQENAESFTRLRSPQGDGDPNQPRTFEIPLYGKAPVGIFLESNYSTIEGIDMSHLTQEQRKKVMYVVNNEGCTCGCSMTLVQCINIDSTCPLRSKNIEHAQQLVSSATE